MSERPTAFFSALQRRCSLPSFASIKTKKLVLGSCDPLQTVSLPPTSILLLSTDDMATTSQSFEPVLNVPALGSFLVIMTVFLLLRLRVGAISEAAETRMAALATLREVKSKELASGDSNVTEVVVQAANAYQIALEREEELRTLLPGIRLRAPNNPQRSEADRQAVRQFLTTDSNKSIGRSDEDQQAKDGASDGRDDTASKKHFLVDMIKEPEAYTEQDPRQPPFAIASALAFVFGSQILLFLLLSMDDTTANQVLTEMSAAVTDASASGTVADAVGDLMSWE